MTDDELIAEAVEARRIAHTMPVYTGSETFKAVRSSGRACAAAERYFALMNKVKERGIQMPPVQKGA